VRKTFQKYLFIFMAVAFVITFSLSFYIQTQQAKVNSEEIINLKIEDAKKQIIQNNSSLATIRQDSDKSAIRKARICAYILSLYPGAVKNADSLYKLTKMLDVDEINVVDGRGFITASTRTEFIGFDMKSGKQSGYFMRLLDQDTQLVQDLQAISYDRATIMQYAGVRRTDMPGFIQIGYFPQRVVEAMRVADIRNLAAGFRIGAGGEIFVCKDGIIESINDASWLNKPARDYGVNIKDEKAGRSFTANIGGFKKLCIFKEFQGYTIVGTLPVNEMFTSRNSTAVELVIFNFILFGVVFALISWLVQRVVISGIYSMNSSLKKITEGDLTEVVQVKTNEEFISLSNGINSTVKALKDAITEAAARLDQELEFAREIQLSSLPNVFPPFPHRNEFDIYATMHTAKEVGGDFYDFFLIGKDRLGLVMADVSGKGVPAALFMMTAKTHIKNCMQIGVDLDVVMSKVNNLLCENNETAMFVTAFVAELNFETGELVYVNAGHNPPLLKRAGGDYEWLKGKSGLILAAMEDFPYEKNTIQLAYDDQLYLYTDGVTEALNTKMELYSNERLESVLNSAKDLNVKELLERIKADIDSFAAAAEQADDITMLSIKYKKREVKVSRLTIPARVDNLETVVKFVSEELEAHEGSRKAKQQLIVAVEEIFVNIARYAYGKEGGNTVILCYVDDNRSLAGVQFMDSGKPYNPLEKEDPDVTLAVEDREVGGLGIYLVKNSMDRISYEYRDGQNVFTMEKNLAEA
jgi:serine phosphatase RsbU (regulator of sigma subunit)/anti-sigma regulatory factor (Ser/Thr protein kinase)